MRHNRLLPAILLTLIMVGTAFAQFPGMPNFSEQIYADGVAWGTKGLGNLPAPNGRNNQSFDKLFAFTNGAPGQLPVAEAAPGNTAYNGGRWALYTATWLDPADGGLDPADRPVLTSYQDIMTHKNMGHLSIASAGTYFECPLLPVKTQ